MLKAGVKVAVIIHLEDANPALPAAPTVEEAAAAERTRSSIKHQLAIHISAAKTIADKATAERLLEVIDNGIRNVLNNLSVYPVIGGDKEPDLGAAFGGDPEPSKDEVN